jgi:hypothetical protein
MNNNKRLKLNHENRSKKNANSKQRLEKLQNDLNNILDFIYDECSELRRLVQLSTEQAILYLKQLNELDPNLEENQLNAQLATIVRDIHTKSDLMLNKIDCYEAESKQNAPKEEPNKELCKLINQFKSVKNLNESQLVGIVSDVRQHIFNRNVMVFKPDELNPIGIGHLQLKQYIEIENFKQIDLNKLINENNIINGYNFKCDIFKQNYLITYSLNYKQTGLFIYDSVNNRIEKQIMLDYPSVNSLKIVNNSIVLCLPIDYSRSENHLVVLDDELNIKAKKSVDRCFLIGANQKYLYCKDDECMESVCRELDWNLKEIESKLKFQQSDPKAPFFISNTNTELSIRQLEYANNRYFVRPGSNILFSNLSDFIQIFDEHGKLIKSTQIDGDFKLDSNNNLVVLKNNNKLIYLDLNGLTFKRIKIEDPNLITHFMLDKNDKIHFFDKFDNKIYHK